MCRTQLVGGLFLARISDYAAPRQESYLSGESLKKEIMLFHEGLVEVKGWHGVLHVGR